MKKQKVTVFCLGYGFTAQTLIHFLGESVAQVIATTRSEDTARRLQGQGITPIVLDGRAEPLPNIPPGSYWLVSAPPDDEGCPAYAAFADQAADAKWIGYLSTTGVYGDLGGNWTFEWTEVNPQSVQGTRRVLAEQQWAGTGAPVHYFRLPGIYGPGRSALDRLREGNARRIIKPGQVFSRVHVDDIASCLAASMARPNPGRVYHPCDDAAAPPQDVIEYAADLLGLPVPPDIPIESANLSEMGKRFYQECKRVSNARTKSELGWFPAYKTYREGLQAILAGEPSEHA